MREQVRDKGRLEHILQAIGRVFGLSLVIIYFLFTIYTAGGRQSYTSFAEICRFIVC